jgi:hypothetical protein
LLPCDGHAGFRPGRSRRAARPAATRARGTRSRSRHRS